MIALVGYTGFVGSNIYKNSNGEIEKVYNSKNIEEAYGLCPDLLIYAGVRAEKYLANKSPEKDMEVILEAQNNISKINPKKLVLISTVDVYSNPIEVNENTSINERNLHAYGLNRYKLEQWVSQNYIDALIIRLPALFGINLKKNFLYDYISYIPFMLTKEKMMQLNQQNLFKYYTLQDNGFYKLNELKCDERIELKKIFKQLHFSALNFSDSRAIYQFYPLERLYGDIKVCLKNNIKLWHAATEPVSVSELYNYLSGENFENHISDKPVKYDFRTIYDGVFSGKNGYIMDKNKILKKIKGFVEQC